jgi:hypothetical protein
MADFAQGASPLEEFTKSMKALNEARIVSPDAGGAVLGGAFGARPAGVLNEEQFNQARLKAFDKLAKEVGMDQEVKLAGAALKGSKEERDIINQNSVRTVSIQDQVLDVVKLANTIHQKNKRRLDEISRKLDNKEIFEMVEGK